MRPTLYYVCRCQKIKFHLWYLKPKCYRMTAKQKIHFIFNTGNEYKSTSWETYSGHKPLDDHWLQYSKSTFGMPQRNSSNIHSWQPLLAVICSKHDTECVYRNLITEQASMNHASIIWKGSDSDLWTILRINTGLTKPRTTDLSFKSTSGGRCPISITWLD